MLKSAKHRSGALLASNDQHITNLLNDPLYDVRPDGSVWSLRTRQGHIGKVWREVSAYEKGGYRFARYKHKHLAVHRLIYAKFNGPLEADLVINHLDGNPANNTPANLELVTQQQNCRHAPSRPGDELLHSVHRSESCHPIQFLK